MVTADEAVLADTHAKFGLRPTWGMSQRLSPTALLLDSRTRRAPAIRFLTPKSGWRLFERELSSAVGCGARLRSPR